MTGPAPTPRGAPEISVVDKIACTAGTTVEVGVQIQHHGTTPANLTVTVLGLVGSWVPEPIVVGPLAPGESTWLTIELAPERGTFGAAYPFVIAAEAKATDGRGPALIGIAESTLVVDGRERISLSIDPASSEAFARRTIRLQLTNPGRQDRELTLSADGGRAVAIRLDADTVVVPAGRTVSVRGKVRIQRPHLLAAPGVHSYAVTARGRGAPEHAVGTVRSVPLIRGTVTKIVGLAVVLALWAAAAIIFIPRLSDEFTARGTAADNAAEQSAASGDGSTGAEGTGTGTGQGGSGGHGTGGGAADGSNATGGSGDNSPGGASSSGDGTDDPGAAGTARSLQLSGTVTGASPQGVSVSLQPTSLIEAAEAGAAPVPDDQPTADALRSSAGAFGKIYGSSLRLDTDEPGDETITMTTGPDGAFGFGAIRSPGYYLLSLAMAGFQTQRFIVNSGTLADAAPMEVAMIAGTGQLAGTVTGPDGPVGAAEITITDGTVSLATSTVSVSSDSAAPSASDGGSNDLPASAEAGSQPGAFSADGLSTPGTYLVTASAPGFGTASSLVTFKAGESQKIELEMSAGTATVLGTVTGRDQLGVLGPLGGVGIEISDGTLTRSATTVTTGPVGTFVIPELPAPGEYTMTITGPGYAPQTRTVSIPENVGEVQIDASLTESSGVLSGTVFGDGSDPLIGVGLTLIGDEVSYKTMTTSEPAGRYRFSGVAPGTYLLTGTLFGRVPGSTTVTIDAAGNATANLSLPAAAGLELAATAHIRGQVLDALTDGTLTCDRTPTPIDADQCRVTVSVQVPVNPTNDDGSRTTVSATAAPADAYTVPALDDPDHAGLVAGQYTVTISAPGYETTTTTVQVAQGQIAVAPQVRLQPLGILSGSITTRVGSPASPSCVVAAPADQPLPTSCTPADGTCSTSGDDAVRCAVVGERGSYEIRGLKHGSYRVATLTTDREYLPVPPTAVQLELADHQRFDAILDRLGRITLTVLSPDPATVELSPHPKAAVSFEATGPTADSAAEGFFRGGTDTTDAVGSARIAGLNGTYLISATGNGSSSVTLPVALNQTVDATLVLTASIGAVVGRVVTSVDGRTVPVGDAQLTVSGVVGFVDGAPVTGSAALQTAADGCFALIPADWPTGGPVVASAECPSVPASARAVLRTADGDEASLVARPVTVAVQADERITDYRAAGTLISATGDVRELPLIVVDAQPSPAGPQALVQLPANAGFSLQSAIVTVTTKPAGAGAVSVSSDGAGNLSFIDSTLSAAGLLVPGRYSLRAEMAGFVAGTADLLCELGKTCRMVRAGTTAAADLTIRLHASLTGRVTIPAPLPTGVSPTDLSISLARAQAAGSGSITVGLGDVAPVVGDGGETIGYRRPVTFKDSVLPAPGLAMAGEYTFTMSLPGYATASATVTCGADYRDGCSDFDFALEPLPRLAADAAVTGLPTGASIGATKLNVESSPSAAGSVTLTVGDDGLITWQDSNLPVGVITPGTYRISAVLPGFDHDASSADAQSLVSGVFTCEATQRSCPLAILMLQRSDLALRFVDDTGAPINDVQARVSGTTLSSPATVNTPATSNSVTVRGTSALPTAEYEIDVQAAGFAFKTYNKSSTDAVTCSGSSSGAAPGLAPQPGGTTVCTVTLSRLGSLPLASFELMTIPRDGDDQQVFTALGSVAVTARAVDNSGNPVPGSSPFPAITNQAGLTTLTGTKTNEGLRPGTYLLQATQDGFGDISGTVDIVETDTGYAVAPGSVGSALPLANGVVRLELPIDTVRAEVTLTSNWDSTTSIMQAMTVTLSGANGDYRCIVPSGDIPPDLQCVGNVNDQQFILFPGVNPGSYRLSITAPDPQNKTFFDYSIWVDVPRRADVFRHTASLFLRSNEIRLNVVDSADQPFPRTATVRVLDQNLGQAVDWSGHDLETTIDADDVGESPRVWWSEVPDGVYYIEVASAGYDTVLSQPFQLTRFLEPNPPLRTYRLVRSARTVQLEVKSTAKGPGGVAAALDGTVLTLDQTPEAGDDAPPAQDPLVNVPVTGPVTGPFLAGLTDALSTGEWTATTTAQPGVTSGPLPAGFASTGSAFTVSEGSGGLQYLSTTLRQRLAMLTVSWDSNSCTTEARPSGDITITVEREDSEEAVTIRAPVNAEQTSATGLIYLPPGNYTWSSSLPEVWEGSYPDLAVSVPADSPAGSLDPVGVTAAMDYPAEPVDVSLTVDGVVEQLPGVAFSGDDPASDPSAQDFTTGIPFCLAPQEWNFRITEGAVLLPDQSSTIGGESTRVDFAGYALTARVALGDAGNRIPDTQDRAVALALAGPVSNTQTVSMAGGAAEATGTRLVVPAGDYQLKASRSPADADVFDETGTSATIDPSDTPTADTLTATLEYAAATVTVTAIAQGSPTPPNGATVALIARGAEPVTDTLGAAGAVVMSDIAAATYDVVVQWVNGSTTYLALRDNVVVARGTSVDLNLSLAAVTTGFLDVRPTVDGEPVPAGAMISLQPSDGGTERTGTTATNGGYRFDNLEASNYDLTATWTDDEDTVYYGFLDDVPVAVGINTAAPVLTATEVAAVTIRPTIAEQGPLIGATITLLPSDGSAALSGTTDDSGVHRFTDIDPDLDYDVLADWSAGAEGSPVYAGTDLGRTFSAGAIVHTVNLAASTTGSFTLRPFVNNADPTDDETVLTGATVRLLPADGSAVVSPDSTSSGRYRFTGLDPELSYHLVLSYIDDDGAYRTIDADRTFPIGISVDTTAVSPVSGTATAVLIARPTIDGDLTTGGTLVSPTGGSVDAMTGGYLRRNLIPGSHTVSVEVTVEGTAYAGSVSQNLTAGINLVNVPLAEVTEEAGAG